MTENYPPVTTQSWDEPSLAPPDRGEQGTGEQGTTDVVKGQAAEVGQSAVDAGKHTAGVAREQAATVAAEAGHQAQNLAYQARDQVTQQAAQQQQLASKLHALGDELGSMSDHPGEHGMGSELARQVADQTHQVARWFEEREPGHILFEVKSFARRRPGTFLAIAAGIGVLAGRVTRGLTASGNDGRGSTGTDVTVPPQARFQPSGSAGGYGQSLNAAAQTGGGYPTGAYETGTGYANAGYEASTGQYGPGAGGYESGTGDYDTATAGYGQLPEQPGTGTAAGSTEDVPPLPGDLGTRRSSETTYREEAR